MNQSKYHSHPRGEGGGAHRERRRGRESRGVAEWVTRHTIRLDLSCGEILWCCTFIATLTVV